MYVTKNKTKCTCAMEVTFPYASTTKSLLAGSKNEKMIFMINVENVRNVERGPLISFIAQTRNEFLEIESLSVTII